MCIILLLELSLVVAVIFLLISADRVLGAGLLLPAKLVLLLDPVFDHAGPAKLLIHPRVHVFLFMLLVQVTGSKGLIRLVIAQVHLIGLFADVWLLVCWIYVYERIQVHIDIYACADIYYIRETLLRKLNKLILNGY